MFLNVYAPPNAQDLPVMIWIHGGGYGLGDATTEDPSGMINDNDKGFIAVSMQYRVSFTLDRAKYPCCTQPFVSQ